VTILIEISQAFLSVIKHEQARMSVLPDIFLTIVIYLSNLVFRMNSSFKRCIVSCRIGSKTGFTCS